MIGNKSYMFKRKFSKIVAVCAVIFFVIFMLGFLNINFRKAVEETVISAFGRHNKSHIEKTCDFLTNVVRQETIDSLARENETLRRALGLGKDALPQKTIAFANVIGISPERSRGLMFIDRGANSGIKTGDIAYVLDKVLIGRVSEVYDDFAVIQTPFARNSRISARLEGRTSSAAGMFVNETGLGGGALEFISKNVNVASGDLVLTNGQDGMYPAGFLIGRVSRQESSAAGAFWNIGVAIPWEQGLIDKVFIARNPL